MIVIRRWCHRPTKTKFRTRRRTRWRRRRRRTRASGNSRARTRRSPRPGAYPTKRYKYLKLQIFATYNVSILVTFYQYFLTGQVFFTIILSPLFWRMLVKWSKRDLQICTYTILVGSIFHKCVYTFTHICAKILQIYVKLEKMCLVGSVLGANFLQSPFRPKYFGQRNRTRVPWRPGLVVLFRLGSIWVGRSNLAWM
jgi:hypothetical protein